MNGLDQVLACDREELVMQWRRAFASSPPKHTSTQLMQKALAYDVQCRAEGGLSTRSRRVLRHALKASHKASKASLASEGQASGDADVAHLSSAPAPSSVPALSAGVQLVREWNGRTWQVEVLEDGFTCGGKPYRSLSAIARMITGTRWSGPRFFGLTP